MCDLQLLGDFRVMAGRGVGGRLLVLRMGWLCDDVVHHTVATRGLRSAGCSCEGMPLPTLLQGFVHSVCAETQHLFILML